MVADSMKNKTVIITGATNGLGKVAAEALAGKGKGGKFFSNCKAVHSSLASYDEQTAQILWDTSLKLTGLA